MLSGHTHHGPDLGAGVGHQAVQPLVPSTISQCQLM